MMRPVILILSLLCATLAFGAGVQGDYVEARNADVFVGACFANSEGGFAGDMAVFGWKISTGTWQGATLDGLSVVGVVRAKSTLGDPNHSAYPVKSVLIVDSRANAEQRRALKAFAQRMGGDLLQDVVRVDYQPIALTIDGDIHGAKATLAAGDLAEIQTRALGDGDHTCANSVVWYMPLTKLEHAMPAFAVENSYRGQGLGAVWKSPGKPSAFVGAFQVQE